MGASNYPEEYQPWQMRQTTGEPEPKKVRRTREPTLDEYEAMMIERFPCLAKHID